MLDKNSNHTKFEKKKYSELLEFKESMKEKE